MKNVKYSIIVILLLVITLLVNVTSVKATNDTMEEVELKSIGFEITSKKGNYLTGEKVTIVETYNKDIVYKEDELPTLYNLELYFEESEERSLATGKANGNKIIYEYTVKATDKGKLKGLSLHGVPTTSSYDSEITANLLLSTGFEITSKKGNYLTGEKITIVETYNKDVDLKKEYKLELHFEEPEEGSTVIGKISGNKVTYEYTVKATDKGKLKGLSLHGVPTTSSYDSEITANLLLSTGFEITSKKGNYLTGEKITIVETYNKNVDTKKEYKLELHFEEPEEGSTVIGKISDNKVTYEYTVKATDKGKLEWLGLNGIPTTSSYDSKITANAGKAIKDTTTAYGKIPQAGINSNVVLIALIIVSILAIAKLIQYRRYNIK